MADAHSGSRSGRVQWTSVSAADLGRAIRSGGGIHDVGRCFHCRLASVDRVVRPHVYAACPLPCDARPVTPASTAGSTVRPNKPGSDAVTITRRARVRASIDQARYRLVRTMAKLRGPPGEDRKRTAT